eukprot:TRINITY_DN7226_c0_g2_i5.p1 TRINITY_DN7226_c0_g2~~TRINITY_DN7226_c0_g2_i5.p1  ORF type:complete len:580 (-),score=30.45 TRINITY_DN7226_c0_g2_i5:300-2039(-)
MMEPACTDSDSCSQCRGDLRLTYNQELSNQHPRCAGLEAPVDKPCDNLESADMWAGQDPEAPVCNLLVRTAGTTCAAFCSSVGMRCLRGQDNVGNTCSPDPRHSRQSTADNGCQQSWNNQLCSCGLEECNRCGARGDPPCVHGDCRQGLVPVNGTCHRCGSRNQPPCQSGCQEGYRSAPESGGLCQRCGGPGQWKCDCGIECGCDVGLREHLGICKRCGRPNQIPCLDDRDAEQCSPGTVVWEGLCQKCGGPHQVPCFRHGLPVCGLGTSLEDDDRCVRCGGRGQPPCPAARTCERCVSTYSLAWKNLDTDDCQDVVGMAGPGVATGCNGVPLEAWISAPPNGSVCNLLVRTAGTTCAAFCSSVGMRCLRGQDNVGNTCSPDPRHSRQSTADNGCQQSWNNQLCSCGLEECNRCGARGAAPCVDGGCRDGLAPHPETGVCQRCGGRNQPPCTREPACKEGHVLGQESTCQRCGRLNQAPCDCGCDFGLRAMAVEGAGVFPVRRVCKRCGSRNRPPCLREGDQKELCEFGHAVVSGLCQECGGSNEPQPACTHSETGDLFCRAHSVLDPDTGMCLPPNSY